MLINNDNFDQAIAILSQADELGVDTETTGLNVRNGVDYLQGISLSTGGFKCYMPWRHQEGNIDKRFIPKLVEMLEHKDLDWHHRKFDMHSLKTLGIDPLAFKGKQFDSMLMFHLWNENFYNYSLDTLAKRFIGDSKYQADWIKELAKAFGWGTIPATVMEPYASHDAHVTFNLKQWIWPKLQAEELDQIYLQTEMPFTKLLYKLEQRGVGVDTDFAKEKARIGRGRMASIQREVKFNPASTKDLKRILIDELNLPVFAHTASCGECKKKKPVYAHEGPPSFNKNAMKDYDDILDLLDNPLAKRVNEYRGWQKAVTSLYEPLIEKVGPDGRIRTEFKQHGTVTGRLSAANPNLQQIPRDSTNRWNGNAKNAFHSGREGYTLIGWDYSQLELRLAAAYGSESILLQEFIKANADPFSVLAPLIFGILTKETRHDTKTFVYANLYGAGVAKIALQLGRPVDEVEQLYRRYKQSIAGIMRVSAQVGELIKQRGYVKYWDGRKRNIKDKHEAYKGWNSLCQGGGAQLVKRAMLRCEEFEDENCQMVLQVHDEITFIIKTELISHYEPMIVKAMTDWPQFGVNFAVEGKAWRKEEEAVNA